MRWLLLLGIVAGCDDTTIEHHVATYDSRIGEASAMDIYTPAGALARPAVLMVHGGSWVNGDRSELGVAAKRLAEAGYVTATIEYRLGSAGRFPLALEDCLCALAFFRAHADEYGLDPARVAVFGFSAGGHLVSMMGLAADDPTLQDPGCPSGATPAPAAVINSAGPSDLTQLTDSPAVNDFIGRSIETDRALWEHASPLFHIRADAPPFLIIHSEGDLIVPVAQSEHFRDALADVGADVRLLAMPGGGHALNEGPDLSHEVSFLTFDSPEAWLATADFLSRTVGQP
jgi:acetyl esterase/lipase